MLNKISRTSFISDISAISWLTGAHILMSWSIPLVARTESERHSYRNFYTDRKNTCILNLVLNLQFCSSMHDLSVEIRRARVNTLWYLCNDFAVFRDAWVHTSAFKEIARDHSDYFLGWGYKSELLQQLKVQKLVFMSYRCTMSHESDYS